MPSINLTETEIENLFFDDYDKSIFEVVEKAEWCDEGKYSTASLVFKKDDKFYTVSCSRSGDYFSDYEYYFYETECHEVIKVPKTIEVWEVL